MPSFTAYLKEVAEAIRSMSPQERTERRERYWKGEVDAEGRPRA